MPEKFIISDTHLGHNNIIKFEKEDGSKLRSFSSIEEHDETLINNWNKTVNPKDTVYHLGDVVINRRCLKMLDRLNGRKILIPGNHDLWKAEELLAYFDDMRGVMVKKIKNVGNVVFTHIPVHPSSKGRFVANVHGHTHAFNLDDPWYVNVSCEQINLTPLSWDDMIKRIPKQ